jgi:DNA-binding response OmpR family regulator
MLPGVYARMMTFPIRSLIVDDDPTWREGMKALVQTLGQEADTAATVAEGLKKLDRGPTQVLLDLNLPDGLGTVILAHVRAQGLPIRVAVMSATNDASLLSEVKRLGADAFFPKPLDVEAVCAWLEAGRWGFVGASSVSSPHAYGG